MDHLANLDDMRVSAQLILSRVHPLVDLAILLRQFPFLTGFNQGLHLEQQVDRHTDNSNYKTKQPLGASETKITVNMEGRSRNTDKQGLQSEDAKDNDDKDDVVSDASKDVDLHRGIKYLIVDFAAVDEIEDLHHHEGIEDEGEVAGVDTQGIEGSFVVSISRNSDDSATADSASYLAVVPFPLRVGREVLGIEAVDFLRDEGLPCEDEDADDNDLEDGLPDDVFHHVSGNDVVVAAVRLAFQKLVSRSLGSESKGGKGVHDEVDPQHLDRGEDLLADETGPDEGNDHGYYVDGELELDELADGVEDVATPEDGLDDGVEVVIDEDDGCCFSGYFSAGDAHGKPDIGFLQCRGIIGPIARGSHNISPFSEPSHQGILVLWSRSGQN